MSGATTVKKSSCFKTSYECAHHYKNVLQNCPNTKRKFKPRLRPDLYFYDPIINEKLSTYNKYYGPKKLEKYFENYGKVDLSKKYTLKKLYDDFHSRPVKMIKFNKTVSGSDYDDPDGSFETKLLQKFYTETSPNKINSSFNEKSNVHISYPYTTTYESSNARILDHDWKDRQKREDCNKREKKEVPVQKFFPVIPRVYFKVPFKGDTSTYGADYRNPASKPYYLNFKCVTKT